MSEPTPPEPQETRSFAAPVPPQTEPTPAPTGPRRSRRRTLLMGGAAAGLLTVGVAVGVVVGQATAGSAAADTGSTTEQVGPGSDGTPPDGMVPGGRGGFGHDPDGDDGTTPDDGSTDDDGTT